VRSWGCLLLLLLFIENPVCLCRLGLCEGAGSVIRVAEDGGLVTGYVRGEGGRSEQTP